MRVLVRNPRRRELNLPGGRRVEDLLRELALNPESHIVVRQGELLTRDQWLREEDEVEIVSAISGGKGAVP